jgi:hypothetical protein
VIRGVSVLITPARPAFYFVFFLLFGPDRRVPLNFLAFSMWALVQSLFATAPSRVGAGGWIFPSLIQVCRVARDMPIALAASFVVQGLGLIDKKYTAFLDTCQVIC